MYLYAIHKSESSCCIEEPRYLDRIHVILYIHLYFYHIFPYTNEEVKFYEHPETHCIDLIWPLGATGKKDRGQQNQIHESWLWLILEYV